MRGETKDLFAELARPAGSARPVPLVHQEPDDRSRVSSIDPCTRIDHMAATRRLRVKLRRAQSHSPEEGKAGRLICRHLLAMLDEAQTDTEDRTQRSAALMCGRSQNDSVYTLVRASNR